MWGYGSQWSIWCRRRQEKLLLLNKLLPDVDFSKHLAVLPEGAGISWGHGEICKPEPVSICWSFVVSPSLHGKAQEPLSPSLHFYISIINVKCSNQTPWNSKETSNRSSKRTCHRNQGWRAAIAWTVRGHLGVFLMPVTNKCHSAIHGKEVVLEINKGQALKCCVIGNS